MTNDKSRSEVGCCVFYYYCSSAISRQIKSIVLVGIGAYCRVDTF